MNCKYINFIIILYFYLLSSILVYSLSQQMYNISL